MDETRVQQLIQQALEAQEQRFTSTIAELRTEVTVVTKLFESLNPPSSSFAKPRLPHPDKFDGSLSAWEVWYPEMKAKLRIDRQTLGEEEAQFWYIYGRLEKQAGGDPMVIGAIHKQEDSGSEGSDDSDTGGVGKLWYNSAIGKYRKI